MKIIKIFIILIMVLAIMIGINYGLLSIANKLNLLTAPPHCPGYDYGYPGPYSPWGPGPLYECNYGLYVTIVLFASVIIVEFLVATLFVVVFYNWGKWKEKGLSKFIIYSLLLLASILILNIVLNKIFPPRLQVVPGTEMFICLSENTLINTPNGQVRVQYLKKGALIYSKNKEGQTIIAPVAQTIARPVGVNTKLVRLILADGRQLLVSFNHPTTNGKPIGSLKAGDSLDGSIITKTEYVPYHGKYTYDILPQSNTGFYFANGILLASTLKK